MSGSIFIRFISYRREDSWEHAARIYAELKCHFGSRTDRFGTVDIFMDTKTIRPGDDSIDTISKALRSCDVLVAVIEHHWIKDKQGKIRIRDRTDVVRQECRAALRRGIIII